MVSCVHSEVLTSPKLVDISSIMNVGKIVFNKNIYAISCSLYIRNIITAFILVRGWGRGLLPWVFTTFERTSRDHWSEDWFDSLIRVKFNRCLARNRVMRLGFDGGGSAPEQRSLYNQRREQITMTTRGGATSSSLSRNDISEPRHDSSSVLLNEKPFFSILDVLVFSSCISFFFLFGFSNAVLSICWAVGS